MTKIIRSFLPRLGPMPANLDNMPGWHRIDARSLKDLVDPDASEKNDTTVSWDPTEALPMRGVPTPWARKVLFERALLDERHPFHLGAKSQWRGMLALLAFHRVLGLKLTGGTVDLNNSRQQRLRDEEGRFARHLRAHYPGSRGRDRESSLEIGCISIFDGGRSPIPFAATSEKVLLFPGVRGIGEEKSPEAFLKSIHPFVNRLSHEFQDPLADIEWKQRADQRENLASWVGQLLVWLEDRTRRELLAGGGASDPFPYESVLGLLEGWKSELLERSEVSGPTGQSEDQAPAAENGRVHELLGPDDRSSLVQAFRAFPVLPRIKASLDASVERFGFRSKKTSSVRSICPSAPDAKAGAGVKVRLFRGRKPVTGTIPLPGGLPGDVEDGFLRRADWEAATTALAGSDHGPFLDLTTLFEPRLCRWTNFRKGGRIGPGLVFLKVGKEEALFPIKLEILDELKIGSAELPDLMEAKEVDGAIEVSLKIPIGDPGSDLQVVATRRYQTGDGGSVAELDHEGREGRDKIPALRIWPTLAGPSWRTYQIFARGLEDRVSGIEALPVEGEVQLSARHQSENDAKEGRCWWRLELDHATERTLLPFRYVFGSPAYDGSGLFFLDRLRALEEAPASESPSHNPHGWRKADGLEPNEVAVDLGSTHTAVFRSTRYRKKGTEEQAEPSSIQPVHILPLTGTLLGGPPGDQEQILFFPSPDDSNVDSMIKTVALLPSGDWKDGVPWTPGLGSMFPMGTNFGESLRGRESRVKLKWGQGSGGNGGAEKDDVALKVFLTHLLWQVKASLAVSGSSIGRLFWSYPGSMGYEFNSSPLRRLQRAWDEACADADLGTGPDLGPVLQLPITEGEAITHYTVTSDDGLDKGTVIIDVGGSTTDIAVIYDGKRSYDSLRLAGGFLSPLLLFSQVPEDRMEVALSKASRWRGPEDRNPKDRFRRLSDMMLKGDQVPNPIDLNQFLGTGVSELEKLAFPTALAVLLHQRFHKRNGAGPGAWADIREIARTLDDGVAQNVRGGSEWAKKGYLSPIHSAVCITAGAIAFYCGMKVREAFEARAAGYSSFMERLHDERYVVDNVKRGVLEVPVHICGKGSLLFAWLECVAGNRKESEYAALESLMRAGFHLKGVPQSELRMSESPLSDIRFRVQKRPHENKWKEEVGRGLLVYRRRNSESGVEWETEDHSPWGEEGLGRPGREADDAAWLRAYSPRNFTVLDEDAKHIAGLMVKEKFRTNGFAVLRAFVDAFERQVGGPDESNPWRGLSCGLGRSPKSEIEESDDFAGRLEEALELLTEGDSVFALEVRALVAALFGVRRMTSRESTL